MIEENKRIAEGTIKRCVECIHIGICKYADSFRSYENKISDMHKDMEESRCSPFLVKIECTKFSKSPKQTRIW